jgi:hypothetical protein
MVFMSEGKTIKTFSHAEDGDLERLEGGAVVA